MKQTALPWCTWIGSEGTFCALRVAASMTAMNMLAPKAPGAGWPWFASSTGGLPGFFCPKNLRAPSVGGTY